MNDEERELAALLERADKTFAEAVRKVIDSAPDIDMEARAGTVAGMLLRTGIRLAVMGGTPKDVLCSAFIDVANSLYKSN
jgi:histidinol phosphatase-like enzyme